MSVQDSLEAAKSKLQTAECLLHGCSVSDRTTVYPGTVPTKVSKVCGVVSGKDTSFSVGFPIEEKRPPYYDLVVGELRERGLIKATSSVTNPFGEVITVKPGASGLDPAQALPPYYRLTFDTVPGTREGIAEQKAAALAYLAAYVERYDQLYVDTVSWLKDNCFTGDTVPATYAINYGDSYALTWASIEFSQRPPAVPVGVAGRFVSKRPDPAIETSSIESFYNTIMDSIQNEVLDELVKLHPSVKWRDKPFSSVSLDQAMAKFDVDLDARVPWRSSPWYSDSFIEEISLEEDFPAETITDAELVTLLVTKSTWLVARVNDIIARHSIAIDGADPARLAMIDMVRRDLGAALWRKLDASNLTARALKVVPSLDSSLSDFLKLGAEHFSRVPGRVFTTLDAEITAAGKAGSSFHRGTLVLCTPGRFHIWKKQVPEAVPLLEVLGISGKSITSLAPTALYKLLNARIPRLMVALASGACVVGHPGLLCLQSYAVTAKRYGFNVLVDRCELSQVTAAVQKLYRLSPKDAAAQAAVTALRTHDSTQLAKYWYNVISISEKEKGTLGSAGTPADGSDGLVFQDTKLVWTDTAEFPISTARFNPKPVTSHFEVT